MTRQGHQIVNRRGQSELGMSFPSRELCIHPCFMFHRMSHSTVRLCLVQKKAEVVGGAAGTDLSLKDKIEENRAYLKGRQRCVLNSPWVGKLDDVIHVTVDADWAGNPKTRSSTCGGVLAIGLCFTVRHWSVTQATVSLSSADKRPRR